MTVNKRNQWIDFVKETQKEYGLSYRDALIQASKNKRDMEKIIKEKNLQSKGKTTYLYKSSNGDVKEFNTKKDLNKYHMSK